MLGLLIAGLTVDVQGRQSPAVPDPGDASYAVFVQSRQIGQETVAIVRQGDGWVVRGTNRLGAPLDITTRSAEVHYDAQWRPTLVQADTIVRNQQVLLKTRFLNGQATSEVSVAGQTSTVNAEVSPDAVVLLNTFVGSYAALARRLIGTKPGDSLSGFVAPQARIDMRVESLTAERIDTPREDISATRYGLVATSAPPLGDLNVSVWIDERGNLLRLSVPAQALELARLDIASAATRTSSFSLPNDETVRVPASGFSLAANVTTPPGTASPAGPAARRPAVILVAPSGTTDRDGVVAGVPVLGQLAGGLAGAGFVVVRYDRRGVGQTGGRAETATIADYAEDVRAIVTWLEKSRKDVDKDRIGVIGYGDGAWVALQTAARDRRVGALAVIAANSGTGADVILEQQRILLDRLDTPAAERDAKIELQKRINAAALKDGGDWEGVPDDVRRAAEGPYFQSYLNFDVARVMRDLRQPLLVVQAALDSQVPAHHADRLVELGRARKRKVESTMVTVPGVNHLLVPAKTGAIDEYATLADKTVAPAAITALSGWMSTALQPN